MVPIKWAKLPRPEHKPKRVKAGLLAPGKGAIVPSSQATPHSKYRLHPAQGPLAPSVWGSIQRLPSWGCGGLAAWWRGSGLFSSNTWPSWGGLVVCDAALYQGRHELHVSGHEAVVGMDQLPSTAVQTGLLEGRQGEAEAKDVLPGPSPSFPSLA